MWENVYPVSGTEIQTHGLLNASPLPLPQDQRFHTAIKSVINNGCGSVLMSSFRKWPSRV